jgi:hypothetical protein
MLCGWIVELFIALLVMIFILLTSQSYIVRYQLKARDPELYSDIGGHGYDRDVMGLYGVGILLKVLKGLRGRKNITCHFKVLYHTYLISVVLTGFLIALLFIVIPVYCG